MDIKKCNQKANQSISRNVLNYNKGNIQQNKIKDKRNAHNITENCYASPGEELKGGIVNSKKDYRYLKENIIKTKNLLSVKIYNIILILSLLIFAFILSFQPYVFNTKNSSAVGLSANTFYKNAPIYVAGGATVNDGTISLDSVTTLF